MRFPSLEQWLAWQESLHPDGMDLGLERCRALRDTLGWDRLPFPVVMVAGTNGKGSTVAFLEAIFRAGGLRAGAYTSPHLVRYNERIRVDGEEADDASILAAFARLDEARGDTTVTYFEFGTFAAVDVFLAREVDVAILEVGIGGRLDAVNVFEPDVSLVTAIGIDHVKWLGPDRESAGREKAGIFRAGRPAIVADPSPPRSLALACEALGAERYQLGEDFNHTRREDHWEWRGPGRVVHRLPYPGLRGTFQLDNAAGAVMAVHCLRSRLALGDAAVAEGVAGARVRGRFEILPGTPGRVLDIAHNPDAARAFARSLLAHPCAGETHAVVGMLADKDHAEVLAPMVGLVDHWHVAGLEGPRGAGAEVLAGVLRRWVGEDAITVHRTVAEAGAAALARCTDSDRVLVFGSCYTVGEALASEAFAAPACMGADG